MLLLENLKESFFIVNKIYAFVKFWFFITERVKYEQIIPTYLSRRRAMKKNITLFVLAAVLLFTFINYSLPLLSVINEYRQRAGQQFSHNEIAAEINKNTMEHYASAFDGISTLENIHAGCLYEPETKDHKQSLVQGGFRFLVNIYEGTDASQKIEELIASYERKHPRALFVVDPLAVLIAHGPEGEILGWEWRHVGFSLWYAPADALDFVCPAKGMVFA